MDDLIGIFLMDAVFISFFLSPIIALICGIVRASKYNDAKLKQIMKPDSYTDEDIKDMKKGVITSFVVAIVLTVILTGTTYLLNTAITFM